MYHRLPFCCCVVVFRPVWELCVSLAAREHSWYLLITCARSGLGNHEIQKYPFSSTTSCGTSILVFFSQGANIVLFHCCCSLGRKEGGYCSLCVPEVRFPLALHSRHPCVSLELFAAARSLGVLVRSFLFLLASSFILTRVEREEE